MKKISLEAFKSKFMDESKESLLKELTGGVLGHCHCDGHHHEDGGNTTFYYKY